MFYAFLSCILSVIICCFAAWIIDGLTLIFFRAVFIHSSGFVVLASYYFMFSLSSLFGWSAGPLQRICNWYIDYYLYIGIENKTLFTLLNISQCFIVSGPFPLRNKFLLLMIFLSSYNLLPVFLSWIICSGFISSYIRNIFPCLVISFLLAS